MEMNVNLKSNWTILKESVTFYGRKLCLTTNINRFAARCLTIQQQNDPQLQEPQNKNLSPIVMYIGLFIVN